MENKNAKFLSKELDTLIENLQWIYMTNQSKVEIISYFVIEKPKAGSNITTIFLEIFY